MRATITPLPTFVEFACTDYIQQLLLHQVEFTKAPTNYYCLPHENKVVRHGIQHSSFLPLFFFGSKKISFSSVLEKTFSDLIIISLNAQVIESYNFFRLLMKRFTSTHGPGGFPLR
jgi:hypothetical protein